MRSAWKEFVVELLHERGWSQRELAERCGVSESAVSRWVRGTSLPCGAARTLLADLAALVEEGGR